MRTSAPAKPITYNGQRPDALGARVPLAAPRPNVSAEVAPEKLDQFDRGASSAPVKARPALVRGTTGSTVRKLQKTLHSLGFLSSEAMATGPGVFGPRTEQALKAFQDAQGLKPTGQLDALTELALLKSPRR